MQTQDAEFSHQVFRWGYVNAEKVSSDWLHVLLLKLFLKNMRKTK